MLNLDNGDCFQDKPFRTGNFAPYQIFYHAQGLLSGLHLNEGASKWETLIFSKESVAMKPVS